MPQVRSVYSSFFKGSVISFSQNICLVEMSNSKVHFPRKIFWMGFLQTFAFVIKLQAQCLCVTLPWIQGGQSPQRHIRLGNSGTLREGLPPPLSDFVWLLIINSGTLSRGRSWQSP